MHPLNFQTSAGPLTFNVWDTMGQESAGGEVNGEFYKDADCAILMFDVARRDSYRQTPVWYR